MRSKKYLDGFKPYSHELVKEYRENGAWEDLSYGDLLDRASAQFPDKIAVIDDQTRLTYKALRDQVDRFAIALVGLGIRPHDRMILQLPNRYEFVVAFYGMQKIGAVPVLAVPRHAHREISTFFNLTEAPGWVVPVRDGKIAFEPLIRQVQSEYERLKYLIMLGDGEALPGALSMEKLIGDIKREDYPEDFLNPYRPDPNDVAVLIPTGGHDRPPQVGPPHTQ